jgi:hypothetical protein
MHKIESAGGVFSITYVPKSNRDIIIIISFMHGIYTYIPERNHVSREYSVSAIM